MFPHNKIQTYTGDTLDYTLENEAINVHTHDALNGLGNFTFSLPTVKGTTDLGYLYNDIAENDKVKIWLWDAELGSCPATPNFVGKITNISAPLTKESGYVRVFAGKSLDEILFRRIKSAKYWKNIDADDVVLSICNDLGLGTGQVETETRDVTVFVNAERYVDLLQRVSDYWIDGANQIKKDWHVSVDNNLVWHSRPFRSSGVETLEIGKNIINYNVLRDVEPVKNDIKVYGQKSVLLPADKDEWTEDSTAGWSCYNDGTAGTVSIDDTTKKVGDNSIKFTFSGVSNWSTLRKTFDPIEILTEVGFSELHFYWKSDVGCTLYLKLLAPDTSNYYSTGEVTSCAANTWTDEVIVNLSTAINSVIGNPSLDNVQALWLYCGLAGQQDFWVDGLYFSKRRAVGTASDATSQTNYEKRELRVTDDSLTTDSECSKRAATLLYQLKDAPIRIDMEIIGNTNVLVGDRIPVTIPAEGINSANFDVLTVDHTLDVSSGFRTKVSMVSAGDVRQLPCGTPLETIQRHLETQRQIARGIQLVK